MAIGDEIGAGDIGDVASSWGGHTLPTLDSGKYLTNDGTDLSWGAVSLSGYLKADGTVALTANWDVGAFTITGTQFISDIADGTAPFGCTSTTVVSNLNADQVDGKDSSDLMLLDGTQAMGANLRMGAYLIGYDGTASKGLSFDSGNEKVTLESGQLIVPAGSAAAPSIGWTDTGFVESSADEIGLSFNGTQKWKFTATIFQSETTTGAALLQSGVTATQPTVCPRRNDQNTGVGSSDADQLSLIAGGVEGIRIAEDTTITITANGDIWPGTDNTYYLGENSVTTPHAWKGLVLKDQDGSGYFMVDINAGAIRVTEIT